MAGLFEKIAHFRIGNYPYLQIEAASRSHGIISDLWERHPAATFPASQPAFLLSAMTFQLAPLGSWPPSFLAFQPPSLSSYELAPKESLPPSLFSHPAVKIDITH
jgi:hypothetical protein